MFSLKQIRRSRKSLDHSVNQNNHLKLGVTMVHYLVFDFFTFFPSDSSREKIKKAGKQKKIQRNRKIVFFLRGHKLKKNEKTPPATNFIANILLKVKNSCYYKNYPETLLQKVENMYKNKRSHETVVTRILGTFWKLPRSLISEDSIGF